MKPITATAPQTPFITSCKRSAFKQVARQYSRGPTQVFTLWSKRLFSQDQPTEGFYDTALHETNGSEPPESVPTPACVINQPQKVCRSFVDLCGTSTSMVYRWITRTSSRDTRGKRSEPFQLDPVRQSVISNPLTVTNTHVQRFRN